jgi:uncharacterized protein YjiS (DUF1127 family)
MMTTHITHGAAHVAPRFSFSVKFGDMLRTVLATPRLWARRWHDRRALLQLDDHMLRDIGLDRARAEATAARPFWRA